MAAYSEQALQGHWVHSHEEDTEDELVFRPASRGFPRSRGRTSLELRPDGSYLERTPGPVDLPVETGGRWSLAGDRLVLEPEDDRPAQDWELTGAEAERLTFRR